MNTFITLACLLAVVGLSHGGAIGVPILSHGAISTANLYKAAPIPVIKTIAAPIVVSAPIVKTVGLGWDGLGGVGLGGYGLGGVGLGGIGLKGLGWNGVGWNGVGWDGLGWDGLGSGHGWGKH